MAAKIDDKKKLNYEEGEKLAFEKMLLIRESDSTNGVKTLQEKRLGKSCIIAMCGRASRLEDNAPRLSYRNRSVTRLRTAIKNAGFIRHDFNEKITALSNQYPIAEKEVLSLCGLTYLEVQKCIDDVVTKLANRMARTKDKENKKALKEVIQKIKKTSYEPVIFETLARTKEQKAELAEKKKERVAEYLRNQRPLDYQKFYEDMAKLLSSKHNWMPLVAGLVMASGRRSIEVVSYLTANFKPTKNKLEAEFTTNAKTKEEKTYKIPLLVDYEIFDLALTRLRITPRISKLLERVKDENSSDVRNRLISNSIQHQLSQFIKEFSGNKLAELKDGRAMYARIAYVEYCSIERKAGREPNADDLFFQERLGHTEPSTQQSYKKFVVTNEINNRKVKQTKEEAIELAQDSRDRLAELAELFKNDEIADSRAFSKYAEFVIEKIKAEPVTSITTTMIKAELGGNKGIILKFVKIVKEAGLQNPL